MAETRCNIRNCEVLVARLDETQVRGSGSSFRPILQLPLKLHVMPARGDRGEMNYVLLRLAGTLSCPSISEFAEFESPPMAEESRPDAHYFRQADLRIPLDHRRIRQFEDARSGANATLTVNLSSLVWFTEDQKFERVYCGTPLQLIVPRSTWADQVLAPWGLDRVKLVEIRFPLSDAGDNYRAAYTNLEDAERHFANGQWKETLAELYSAFEGLAKATGFNDPNQQFFAHILQAFHSDKKDKTKLALDYLCEFLHLGRHEPKTSPETFQISPSDARFALTMAHAVFEYITPKG